MIEDHGVVGSNPTVPILIFTNMKNLLFAVELILESFVMFLLIILDTLVLYLLQIFNSEYGQNSSDHIAEILVIVQKFESISDKMKEIDSSGDKTEEIASNLLDLFSDYVFQLNKMHYCLWHIIVHG